VAWSVILVERVLGLASQGCQYRLFSSRTSTGGIWSFISAGKQFAERLLLIMVVHLRVKFDQLK